MESISNEICEKVKEQINIQTIFKYPKPDEAIKKIRQGKSVLEKWKKEYDTTKRDIEQQSVKRWDFQKYKEIFSTPLYMKDVLEDLEKA